jgi:hypothetical protein
MPLGGFFDTHSDTQIEGERVILGYIAGKFGENYTNEKSPETLICKEFQGFYL